MDQIQSGDITRMIQEATESLFATMLHLPVEAGTPRQESGDPTPVDGVIAVVGIAGTWTATGQIHCSAELACQLAGALLMADYRAVDGDVLDAVSEVSNMIIGNVKTNLEERLGPLGLSVPTVLYGRNYQARTGGMPNWTTIPFRCGGETMEIRFGLMPTPAALQPHATRPETALTGV